MDEGYNVKVNLEKGMEVVEYIWLLQNRNQWQVLVNMLMNLLQGIT
jgi:hypothetical protein